MPMPASGVDDVINSKLLTSAKGAKIGIAIDTQCVIDLDKRCPTFSPFAICGDKHISTVSLLRLF